MLETIILLGSTKIKIAKNKNGGNVPHLKITEALLENCYIVNNDYQQYSKCLYTFVFNKSFGRLLDLLPKNYF